MRDAGRLPWRQGGCYPFPAQRLGDDASFQLREPGGDERPGSYANQAPYDGKGAGHASAIDGNIAEDSSADFDGVWKEAIETWLPDCLKLFWPQVHASIDWDTPPVFLDKEMKRFDRIIKRGTLHLDKLVRVRLKSGNGALLLIHLEIQAGVVDAMFPVRIFAYYIRLWEKYPDHHILPCAVLLDRDDGSETERYCKDMLGSRLELSFPVVNLGAWRTRMAELRELAPVNPFAVLVLAQLECRATQPDATRLASKTALARAMRQWGYAQDQRVRLFRMIDSLLVLPPALEDRFNDELDETEVDIMRLSSIERVQLRREKEAGWREGLQAGEQKGRQEGRQEGGCVILRDQIQAKFGQVPDWVQAHLAQADVQALRQWSINMLSAERIESVFGL